MSPLTRYCLRSGIPILPFMLWSAPGFSGPLPESVELEVKLVSRPLPPNIEAWDFRKVGSSGTVYSSEAELLSAIAANASAGDNGCSKVATATGSWSIEAELLGLPSSERRPYRITGSTWRRDYEDPLSEPACRAMLSPATGTMRRDRSIDCAPFPGYQGDSATGSCVNPRVAIVRGVPPSCDRQAIVGDPCDAATGEYTLSEVDYSGPFFDFRRSYHSYAQFGHAELGVGWTHSYSARLVITAGRPRIWVRADGYTEPLNQVDPDGHPGVYFSATGSGAQVRALGSDWSLYRSNGERERYDEDGLLLEMESAAGQVTVIERAPDGRVLGVVGPFGHRLAFEYGAPGGRLRSLVDPAGGSIRYQYDNEENPADSSGNLVRVTYQDQSIREYLYEDAEFPNHLTGVIDENGDRYINVEYDDIGRAVLSERAGGIGRITLSYNENSTTNVTDAAGNTSIYSFTNSDNPWRWRYKSYVHDSMKYAIDAARSERPQNWNLEPAQFGDVIAAGSPYRRVIGTELAGERASVDVDQDDYARRSSASTDENGNMTVYEYDLFRMTEKVEAAQDNTGAYRRETRYEEFLDDTSALPRRVTMPSVRGGQRRTMTTTYHVGTRLPHQVTVAGYTAQGMPVSRTVSFEEYDNHGQLTRINGPQLPGADGADDVTVMTYYETDATGSDCAVSGGGRCGRLRSITNALGHSIRFDEYFSDGRLKTMTDPNGLVTEFGYTDRGWISRVIQTAGQLRRETRYSYTPSGLMESASLPGGLMLSYQWTAAHLLQSVTDNAGNKIEYQYDLRGNRTAENVLTSGGGLRRALTRVYDVRNRAAAMQEGFNNSTRLTFDAVGNLQEETDPNGNVINYDYDPLNRLRRLVRAINAGADAVTDYAYDAADNIKIVSAANGATTRYEYDDLGNLRRETSPDRGTTLYGYDGSGNMTCKVDGRHSDNAVRCEQAENRWVYRYDVLNRITSIDYLETPSISPDVSFDYDASGSIGWPSLVSHESEGGQIVDTQFEHDVFGNMLFKRQYVPESPGASAPFRHWLIDMTAPTARSRSRIPRAGSSTTAATNWDRLRPSV